MDDNHGKAAIFDLDGTLLDSMGVFIYKTWMCH